MTTHRLSVVVPVHGQSAQLAESLSALDDSDLPRAQWQLVVVDDGSGDDENATVAAAFADIVIRLPKPAMGAGYARNRGVDLADAPVVVFVDPGVAVDRRALGRIVSRFEEEPNLSALVGALDPPKVRPDAVSSYEIMRRQFAYAEADGRSDSFCAALAAIRKDVFIRAGMYDEWRVGVPNIENAELGERIRLLGVAIEVDSTVCGVMRERRPLIRFALSRLVDHGRPWNPLIQTPRRDNIGRTSRRRDALCVVAAWTAIVAAIVAGSSGLRELWSIVVLGLIVITAAQIPLLRFAALRCGRRCVAATVPLLVLDSVLDGASRVYAWSVRMLIGEPRPNAAIEALAEVGASTWPPVPVRREPGGASQRAS